MRKIQILNHADLLNLCVIILTGLFCAILIYPFLHECGHLFVALFCGVSVKEIKFLPIASVLCEISMLNLKQMIALAISGELFPFFCSFLFVGKPFFIKCMRVWMRCIVLLSLIISLITLINKHIANIQDDINKILMLDVDENILFLSLVFLCFSAIFFILYERPIDVIFDKFSLKTKKPNEFRA